MYFHDFYPRPPGGGRRYDRQLCFECLGISIHALRVEGDDGRAYIELWCESISIHALRVEGDPQSSVPAIMLKHNFYPRPPGGGRPSLCRRSRPLGYISIHALRVEGDKLGVHHTYKIAISIHALRVEGDQGARLPNCTVHISIHALRVEGDRCGAMCKPGSGNDFYPRPPGGGRRTA